MFQGLISGFGQARIRFNALEEVKDSIGTYQGRRDQKNKSGAAEEKRAGGKLSGTAKAVAKTALAVRGFISVKDAPLKRWP